ncbi:MAG: F0F1 ATP synthase subunit epsilon [Gemmatimonadales bacterium]|jgi:F-type H+-transporting ATPase subunit epsilon
MAVPGSGRPFNVSLISPERKVFEGPAKFLVVPSFDGEIGILRDHAPLMALLGEGTLRIVTEQGTRRFHVSGGFVQVVNNEVSVLSEEATEG